MLKLVIQRRFEIRIFEDSDLRRFRSLVIIFLLTHH